MASSYILKTVVAALYPLQLALWQWCAEPHTSGIVPEWLWGGEETPMPQVCQEREEQGIDGRMRQRRVARLPPFGADWKQYSEGAAFGVAQCGSNHKHSGQESAQEFCLSCLPLNGSLPPCEAAWWWSTALCQNVATQMCSKITQIALKLALHPQTHAKRQACVYMTHMYKAGEGTQFSQGQTPHPEPTPWVSITISYLFLFPCHSYHVAVFATAICLPFTMYCTLETVTVSGRATSFKSTSNRQNLWDWSDYPIRLHMIVDWNVLFKWMAMGTIW